jgi:SagB-type dehydrogenase family enzyme
MKLPAPRKKGTLSLEETIQQRRSVRRYGAEPLDWPEIAQLLWAGQGVTDRKQNLRAAPSAGAIYPIELFVATPDGFFRYAPRPHSLTVLIEQDVRAQLAAAAYNQDSLAQAGIIIILAADYAKISEHYGPAATRYTDMEAGHIAQNIALQATALGLATVPIGAFDAVQVRGILSLPANREPVYLLPIGHGA